MTRPNENYNPLFYTPLLVPTRIGVAVAPKDRPFHSKAKTLVATVAATWASYEETLDAAWYSERATMLAEVATIVLHRRFPDQR